MLHHLSIQNFALVDQLDLDLGPGMTVVSGETGAGKSIMLDALALTLGNRADAGTIGPHNCPVLTRGQSPVNRLKLKIIGETCVAVSELDGAHRN